LGNLYNKKIFVIDYGNKSIQINIIKLNDNIIFYYNVITLISFQDYHTKRI
jgi:hypothetical protein